MRDFIMKTIGYTTKYYDFNNRRKVFYTKNRADKQAKFKDMSEAYAGLKFVVIKNLNTGGFVKVETKELFKNIGGDIAPIT